MALMESSSSFALLASGASSLIRFCRLPMVSCCCPIMDFKPLSCAGSLMSVSLPSCSPAAVAVFRRSFSCSSILKQVSSSELCRSNSSSLCNMESRSSMSLARASSSWRNATIASCWLLITLLSRSTSASCVSIVVRSLSSSPISASAAVSARESASVSPETVSVTVSGSGRNCSISSLIPAASRSWKATGFFSSARASTSSSRNCLRNCSSSPAFFSASSAEAAALSIRPWLRITSSRRYCSNPMASDSSCAASFSFFCNRRTRLARRLLRTIKNSATARSATANSSTPSKAKRLI